MHCERGHVQARDRFVVTAAVCIGSSYRLVMAFDALADDIERRVQLVFGRVPQSRNQMRVMSPLRFWQTARLKIANE